MRLGWPIAALLGLVLPAKVSAQPLPSPGPYLSIGGGALQTQTFSNGSVDASFQLGPSLEKPFIGTLLELGQEPPHTHVLNDLVGNLAVQGVDVASIAALPLKALTRMTISSRYPIATAEAVIAFLEQLDRPGA